MTERVFITMVGRSCCELCRGRIEPGEQVVKAPGPIFPRLYYCERCMTKEKT